MHPSLYETDPEVAEAISQETRRQSETLELIASENYVSEAVLEAMGSVFTNKYAEGYPGRRYYGGCEHVDVVESLAIERAKRLFGADHANVQPHSGTQANIAVYLAALEPGDKILGMNLSHGGHLSHGHPLNFSGKYFRVAAYGVRRDTEEIDYDELEDLAKREKPRMIVAGASAYSRTIHFDRLSQIARGVGAYLLADIAHIAVRWRPACIPAPFPSPISSRRRLTRPCADPEAASSSAVKSTRNGSTGWFFPAPRGALWFTPSRPRRSASRKPSAQASRAIRSRSFPTPRPWPGVSASRGSASFREAPTTTCSWWTSCLGD